MAFAKKIIILSSLNQESSAKGMVTLEKTASGIKGTVALYNFPELSGKEYELLIKSEGKPLQRVRLGAACKSGLIFAVNPELDINGKLFAAVSEADTTDSRAIVYGANCNVRFWQSGLLEEVKPIMPVKRTIEISKKPPVPTDESMRRIDLGEISESKKLSQKDAVVESRESEEYDDEAIAATNYYSTADDEEMREKIATIAGLNRIARELPDDININDAETAAAKTEYGKWNGYNTLKENTREFVVPEYYAAKYPELRRLFDNYPGEDVLNEHLPDTVWVRVEYAENQYYVVGLIGKRPDYIAYGVPGKYSLNPPRELAAYCSWLPLKNEEPQGEGYWMMYQDSNTGASVRLPSGF